VNVWIPILTVAVALWALFLSSDRFIVGVSDVARRFRISPVLIGMVVIGFGTSVPELMVSTLSALRKAPELAIGNALGSNITNIGFILGLTALICPIRFYSSILRKELPLLTGVTLVLAGLYWNGQSSQTDGVLLLIVFLLSLALIIWLSLRNPDDDLVELAVLQTVDEAPALWISWINLLGGLVVLIVSSQALVWGAVEIARELRVSELVIGLAILAPGTSLPELASSIAAARNREPALIIGNILGSNLINTLAVTGTASVIHPFKIDPDMMHRDVPMMTALTLSLFAVGWGFRGPGRINRFEGLLLLIAYLIYMGWVLFPLYPS